MLGKCAKTGFYDGTLFLNDFKVSNDSNVYILTSLDLDKKLLRDKKYTLNIATSKSETLKPISISLDKFFINDMEIIMYPKEFYILPEELFV